MTARRHLTRLLLLTCLLLTGVRCKKNTAFVYSTLGGDVLLTCTDLVYPDCSLISWTFFKGGRYTWEVREGQVKTDSDKSSRLSITSNCSLSLRDLRVDDAGSYVCLQGEDTIIDIYLSVLTITSLSTITDLQPGGNLSLSCILFTFYDAGNCKSYSSVFNLSWAAEDGTVLPKDSRYELIDGTRCNITLVINLQREDNNRKWRCQVDTKETGTVAFLDFTSTFLFENPPTSQPLPAASTDCPVHLPISHIVLCVALPVMVIIVGLFTWRGDRNRAKASAAAGIELQDVH